MFVVFAYDIADDRRRARVARILDDVAARVQYSVFEGIMDDDLLRTTMERLRQVVVPGQDQVRIYRICATCRSLARVLGEGKLLEIPEVVIL